MGFQLARKSQAKLRLGLGGPAGAGKTWTALTIAKGIGGRIAVVDTENASASKYAGEFSFDTMQLTDFSARGYIGAIEEAEKGGYDIVVLDGLTPAWDRAKEMAQENEKKTHNSFNAWNGVTQEYKKIEAKIVASSIHVIGTYRAKEEYVQERGDNGKTKIRKLGMGLESGKGQAFVYDVFLDMEEGGTAIVQKTRYAPLNGRVLSKPGVELGKELAAWLSDGVAPEPVSTRDAAVAEQAEAHAALLQSPSLEALKATWGRFMALHTSGAIDAQTYSALAESKDIRKKELTA